MAVWHHPGRMAAVIISFLVFLIMIAFLALMYTHDDNDLYDYDSEDLWRVFGTEMTLADWHNALWLVIFFWQLIWLFYGLTTLCRTTANGYLYCRPHYMPTSVYIIFTLNNILIVAWTLLFDRKEMIAAVVIGFFVSLSALLAFCLSLRGLYKHGLTLQLHGHSSEIWWARFTVQNGLALLSTYALVIAMANLALVLVHEIDVEDWPTDSDWPEDAVTICISLLAFHFVLWTALDLTVLDRFTRYVFTPYVATGWGAIAILEENWQQGTRNNMLTIGLLGAALMGIVIKFTTMLWRFITDRNEAMMFSEEKVMAVPPTQVKTAAPQTQVLQVVKVEPARRGSRILAPFRRSAARRTAQPYVIANRY